MSETGKKQFIRSAVGMNKAVAPENMAAADAAAFEQSAREQEHTVAAGESLSIIAKNYYGSANDWPRIYQANKAIIGDNPDRIRVGQKLKIPAK
jgi:nucleoid-associated protein YgaU